MEEARTNLITYSEQFNDASWVKTRASITANSTIAPDGTTTAEKLIEDTSTTTDHFINLNPSGSTSATYTASIFIKSAERYRIRFQIIAAGAVGNRASAWFDSNIGSVVDTLAEGNGSVITTSIQQYPNGWYRCILTGIPSTAGSGTAVNFNVTLNTTSTNTVYTGDGTSGIYIWGAQLEQGSFPTSYIPTEASTRTRAADNASITGKNFSEWYRQDEGTFITKAKYDGFPIIALANRTSFATISTEGTIASWNVWWESGNYAAYAVENPQGTYQARMVSGLISINQTKKIASAYKLNDFAFTADGASPTLDTSGTVPSTIRLFIGSLNGSSWLLNGTISQLSYYPKRLPNSQLQTLTS